MKTTELRNEVQRRAIEALKSAISSVSSIKLIDVRGRSGGKMGRLGFQAHVDVFGRMHTLVCEVKESIQPLSLSTVLAKFRDYSESATPVLIAPYLSPEAQAMCKECNAAFLDLEGNARIIVGEVFIVRRSLPRQVADPAAVNAHPREAAPLLLPRSTIYIASNIPGVTPRTRQRSATGIAVA